MQDAAGSWHPRLMFHALDHVILAVRDLDAASRAYAILLGLRASWRGEHPGEGTANTLFRVDNTYLELLAPVGPGATGDAVRANLEVRGEGLVGLAFATSDAEACHARLADRGLDPEPVENGIGRDVDSGVFREWRRVPIPLAKTRGVLMFGIEHRSPADMLPRAAPVGSESAVVSGLDHVVVRTTDADATAALYGDALGLRLALDRSVQDWGVRLLFFRVGGLTVEVAAGLNDDPQAEPGDRLWGLSWRVSDAELARERLREAGIDVSEVRKGRKPGTRVLTVRDGSCGVPTLLIEPVGSD